MMPGYSDVYVLAMERSADLLSRFLETLAPNREFSADEIEVLETEGKGRLFTDSEAAMKFCIASRRSSTELYWRNLASPPYHVMVFFLEDGHLVLGVSTSQDEAPRMLLSLMQLCGEGAPGYITFEEPPEGNAVAFRDRCRKERMAK